MVTSVYPWKPGMAAALRSEPSRTAGNEFTFQDVASGPGFTCWTRGRRSTSIKVEDGRMTSLALMADNPDSPGSRSSLLAPHDNGEIQGASKEATSHSGEVVLRLAHPVLACHLGLAHGDTVVREERDHIW